MTTKFIAVLFKMALHDGPSLEDHAGFAFETPGWPNFHAVAHTNKEGKWVATHWESGLRCLKNRYGRETREEVPDELARWLDYFGPEYVQEVVAPWGIKL